MLQKSMPSSNGDSRKELESSSFFNKLSKNGKIALIVGLIGLVASLTTILEYFGLNPFEQSGSPARTVNGLPEGTQKTTNSIPPTQYVVVLSNSGPQTISFRDPVAQIESISSTVTTYVDDAVLLFDISGTTYSTPVIPNSNLLLTFSDPLDVSNVRISIDGRDHQDDAVHLEYVYPNEI
jgi:hypothetical protein